MPRFGFDQLIYLHPVMTRFISAQEVTRHCLAEDLWLVVDGIIYDLTEFAPSHPGGAAGEFYFIFVSLVEGAFASCLTSLLEGDCRY